MTDTTPFAPVSDPGVGAKSDAVFVTTPVEARIVTVPNLPYMLVGTFDPARDSAGGIPDG